MPLPTLRALGVRSTVTIYLGISTIFGCTDRLGRELEPAKPEPTTKPSTSDDPPSTSNDADPDGGPAGADAGNTCENDVQDPDETALNCGGVCQPCGVGLSCKENTDCSTGLCKDLVCLGMGCDNQTIDGNESDTDCGVGCVLCGDGKNCNSDADCQSKVCDSEEKKCLAPSCEDERQNGNESAIDCGPGCEPCENGLSCTQDEHCASGACVSMVCADPGCTDGDRNGSETDVDCGGECPDCDDDFLCEEGTDCKSGICAPVTSSVNRCVEATCDDTEINGRESDLNCGGMCDPCADGKMCFTNSDCESLVCTLVDGEDYSLCSAPTCEDEVRNGTESAPDCGGDCDGCDVDMACRDDDDCESEHCDETTKLCVTATCEDGRTNQGESDEDCGGPCDGCGVGQMCGDDTDCTTARCDEVCEAGSAGAACTENEECITGSCGNDDQCAQGYAGDSCYEASDCALDECVDGKCPKGYTGDACDGDSGCHSGACLGDTCGLGGVGDTCAAPADCVSNVCTDAKCAAMRTSVRSQGGASNDMYIRIEMWLQANSQDPQLTWGNTAILYYFTPEARDNFVSKVYESVDNTVRDSRFLALQVTEPTEQAPLGGWVAIWRAVPTNSTAIPSNSESRIEWQVHNEGTQGQSPSPLSNAGDHSYLSGQNPNIVLCVNRNGQWVHARGNAPAGVQDPCDFVMNVCPDSDSTCEVLERRD